MDKFLTLIRRTCAVFGVQASDDLLDAYWSVLGGLPIDALSAAFGRAIAECETMPRPAVILRLAGGRTPDALAADAWAAFSRAWSRFGSRATYEFEDTRIAEAIRQLGGLRSIGQRSADEWHWVRRDFERAYVALLDRAPVPHGTVFGDSGESVFVTLSGAAKPLSLPQQTRSELSVVNDLANKMGVRS